MKITKPKYGKERKLRTPTNTVTDSKVNIYIFDILDTWFNEIQL